MALKPDQKIITTSTLYNATLSNWPPEQLEVNVEATGGNVNVYGSQTLPGSPPTNMTELITAGTGINNLPVVPNYLYFTGTATQIITSGIDLITLAT